MLNLFLVCLVFVLLFMVFMAVGVLAGREPLKGTCGGLNRFQDEDCPVCGGNPAKCESAGAKSDIARDAMKK